MELALLALSGMCAFLAWQLNQEKNTPKPKTVKLAHTPKPKQKKNLSDGAYAFLEHLNKIICDKNGRNINRKIDMRVLNSESVSGGFYNVSVVAIENNATIKDSWYDIQADLSPALVDYLEWIIKHINGGGSIALISNQYEKRAIAVNPLGVAIGEIIIVEDDFDYQEWSD